MSDASDDLDAILDRIDVDASEMPDDYDERYTDPELRWRLKEAIQASGKGGAEGQWSARKAQLLSQEYERRGGDYREGGKTETQEHLEAWTAQEWQTLGGSADADGDAMHRYLPGKVWTMLSDEEQRRAEDSKVREDDEGTQFVDWPDVVRDAMLAAGFLDGDATEVHNDRLRAFARRLGIDATSSMNGGGLIGAIRSADAERAMSAETLARERSKDELYDEAQELEIEGRSGMDKEELAEAVAEARSE